MEEDKLKDSKKVLTDYMLELNADIQRAEDWVNTGADEEMYFALKTVLDRLEQLEKENKELKESHDYIYEAYQDAGKKMFDYQEQLDDSIPKSVIREKIEELEKELPLVTGGRSQGKTYTFIIKFAIKSLKELLGGNTEC